MLGKLRPVLYGIAALAAVALSSAPAAAQSDILLQLRSGSPAGDRFRVDSAGGMVALGEIGYGIIPYSGEGERMMWHPQKVAFRAGYVDASQWDDSNIGYYTWAGGYNNTANGIYSFAMGLNNTTVAGPSAGIALGGYNTVNGSYAVALGYRNTADANYAITLGQRASANGFSGVFVASDQSSSDSLEASATNQFSARYAGGYRLYSNATKTTGVTMNAGGSSWIVVSDRNRKEEFLPIDGEDLLARLENVPVTRWRYTAEENRTVSHIGPMAQDWHAAFGLSDDPLTINMSDFDGVNLAAIQALRVRTEELRTAVAERDERIAELETELADVQARLARIEEMLNVSSRSAE